ncbi:MAG: CDP-glycerol glycerophosphotransferase family protein [Lachnospiraceae bacterium]|nr:CDP-glycerol glycerophosphotransferase family protein [Lachnospiraceae bacterium]
MLKNVFIKRTLKRTVFPLLTLVNKIVPKDDKIIFLYSANKGVQHNLIPLKEYLLNNKFDRKYRIICGVESLSYVDSFNDGASYIGKYKSIFLFMRAGHVFYTTGQIPIKPAKNQIVIHLDHGTTSIKTGNLLTNINNGDDFYFTYYTVPSEIYIPVVKKEFLCEDKNIVINGEPVMDILHDEKKHYTFDNKKKYGLWAPTFRQSDYLGYDDSSQEDLLPMFKESDYEELNSILQKNDVDLTVKLHPLQNLNGHKMLNFSNLHIYSDDDFKSLGYELYKYMRQMDFLIGDYSSVYLEYLVLDRPIAFAIPDLEEYSEKRGFIFDNIEQYMPGEKLYKKDDLYKFVMDIASNKDTYAELRRELCSKIHHYNDGQNCKRCLEISNIYL